MKSSSTIDPVLCAFACVVVSLLLAACDGEGAPNEGLNPDSRQAPGEDVSAAMADGSAPDSVRDQSDSELSPALRVALIQAQQYVKLIAMTVDRLAANPYG